MTEKDIGIVFKGRFCPLWGGLYLSNSSDFDHGALPGIARTLKATKYDAAVVVLDEE